MIKQMLLAITIAGLSACSDGVDQAKQDLVSTFEALDGAVKSGDLDAFVAHYVESPIHLPPGAPINKTRDAIKKHLEGKLDVYILEGDVTIRHSRDASMAYVFGEYRIEDDPSRDVEAVRGRFINIWERQADGSWKCAVDVWNSQESRFSHL